MSDSSRSIEFNTPLYRGGVQYNARDNINYDFQDEYFDDTRFDVWSEMNKTGQLIVCPYDYLGNEYLIDGQNLLVPFYWKGYRVVLIDLDKNKQL